MMRGWMLVTMMMCVIVTISTHAQDETGVITADNIAQLTELEVIGRGVISNAIYSPDGAIIAVAGSRGIWLYDAQNLDEEPRLLNGHRGAVTTIAFSPDGRLLASGSTDEFVIDPDIHLWDVATGEKVATLTGHTDGVGALAFHPSGDWLVSGAWQDDGTIRVWEMAGDDAQLISTTQQVYEGAGATDIDFTPNGEMVAVTLSDNRHTDGGGVYTISFQDLLEEVDNYTNIGGSSIELLAVSYHPTLPRVAYSVFINMGVWDVENNETIFEGYPEDYLNLGLYDVEYSPDGALLAIALPHREIVFWDAYTNQHLFTYVWGHYEYSSPPILPTFSWKYKISFSPDSSKLLITLSNNTVQIWDVQTRQIIGNIDDFTNKTVQIAFQNTDELVAYGINGNKEHVISGTEIQTRQIEYPSGTSMSDAILSPDGDRLIYLLRTIDSLNGIYSYNIGTHETQELYLGKDNIDLVALKRNLLTIARGYGNSETALEIWDLSQGMVISSISTNFPRKGIFSDDLELLYLMGSRDYDIHTLNMMTGEIQTSLTSDNVIHAIALSDDKTLFAIGTWNYDDPMPIEIFNLQTGQRVNFYYQDDTYYNYSNATYALDLSPSNQLLVSGYVDGTVRIWNVETGEQLAALDTHTDSITQVLFNEDGTRLATASEDGTIRLWGIVP